ncbi:hypothetical protein AGMMS4952_24940 [Spirochaetia bacterium]|nr:hypothetical protein AGMMS4952_24940 [Spirochaetia bacterium]
MENLFPPLAGEIRRHVDAIPSLVDRVLPIPKRFRSGLPRDVAELSRLLTSGRGERNETYLSEGPLLSAYLRYFLPWNIYRLARLLPSLSLPLSAGAALTDLGSGPLTLPIALWISRPDLRNVPLEFHCMDRTGAVLDAGKKLFAALVHSDTDVCPWIIKTIKASLGEPIRFPKANLVTAVNLFNELFWKLPRTGHGVHGSSSLQTFTEKQPRFLSSLSLDSGSILVLEPGIPRCGEFISLLRESFTAKGRLPLAPCPHGGPCPLPGGPAGSKWCHFAFDTFDAPAGLHRLSEAAGIPKERAVLSFLLAGPVVPAPEPAPKDALAVRVISDAFPLKSEGKRPAQAALYGRYGCSGRGLALVTGKRGDVEGLESGALETFAEKAFKENGAPGRRDGKSGALIVEYRIPP